MGEFEQFPDADSGVPQHLDDRASPKCMLLGPIQQYQLAGVGVASADIAGKRVGPIDPGEGPSRDGERLPKRVLLTGGEQLLRFASPAVGGFDVGSRGRGLGILGARLATGCLLGCYAQVCESQSQPDFTRLVDSGLPASELPSSATSIALLVAVCKYYILVWGASWKCADRSRGFHRARRAAGCGGAAAHARDELAGEAPSLAVLLASRSHADEAAEVLNAVQETVEPPRLIGCVAQAIVAGRRETEDEAAVAVWLASGLPAETFQLDFVRTGSGGLLAGYRFDRSAHDLHVLLPDPYTFPSNLLVEHLNTDLPGTTVMGGVVSGGLGPGDTRLFRDRDVLTSGVVGVHLPGMAGVPIVSQGCRPIGYPYIVTGADGALITELGGRPPLQRLRETVEVLPPDDQELVSHGLQIGIVVDEHVAVPGQGDFMIRGLLGADPSTGAIKIGEVVEVGTTVQFQVRDAVGADKDLRLAVERAGAQLPGRPAGALLFTCTGRGRRMFGVADHDASTIEELLGGIPLAGFFAAGEIGPIAGRNALHGFTASMALFIERAE